ncbi:hypothetical protein SD427_06780 [Chryseobacterium sp. JJR-5R]|uniref:hypothetical protein n=1 Tax=Chryseobacterium sp. JJR-5R TaxID=3093923 RepID=UPI002A747AA3|nr:hypothetical protein [Chryseobacterium sp. JJR-5R]WPO84029.1 hypothetical protein SD427_06780 [Chryseobacterium sp. JJR-5R]
MKKKNIDFESGGWTEHRKHSALSLMDTFFQFHDPAAAKNRLYEIMEYAQNRKVLMKDNPSVVFHFYLSLRSFVRAGYGLQFKSKKWAIHAPAEPVLHLMLGSLSEDEFRNPFLAFQKAFSEFTIRDFDHFLADIVYFSLGTFNNVPEGNIITPFIHLNKMLDAAQLILERRDHKNNVPAIINPPVVS